MAIYYASLGTSTDELVEGGYYADASRLLDAVDDTALPDKVRIKPPLRLLCLTSCSVILLQKHRAIRAFALLMLYPNFVHQSSKSGRQ
jgi:hypothetical protein